MKKIEKVFSQLSQLYEFNRKLKTYRLKKEKKGRSTTLGRAQLTYKNHN
jgi:hypothetical protein